MSHFFVPPTFCIVKMENEWHTFILFSFLQLKWKVGSFFWRWDMNFLKLDICSLKMEMKQKKRAEISGDTSITAKLNWNRRKELYVGEGPKDFSVLASENCQNKDRAESHAHIYAMLAIFLLAVSAAGPAICIKMVPFKSYDYLFAVSVRGMVSKTNSWRRVTCIEDSNRDPS